MEVRLELVSENFLSVVGDLYLAYVTEMSQYTDLRLEKWTSVRLENYLRPYLRSPGHWAYLIKAADGVAGFCLVKRRINEADACDIEQFFITDGFKRRGVGTAALVQVLNRHPGKWVIRVLRGNAPALSFWLAAVRHVTKEHFCHRLELDDDLIMHFLRFDTANVELAKDE